MGRSSREIDFLGGTFRETDLEKELMVAGVVGEGRWEGIVREFGMDMYTLLIFKMDNQQGLAV